MEENSKSLYLLRELETAVAPCPVRNGGAFFCFEVSRRKFTNCLQKVHSLFTNRPALYHCAGRFFGKMHNFSFFIRKSLCTLYIDFSPEMWYNISVEGRWKHKAVNATARCSQFRKNFSKIFEKPLDKSIKM